MPGCTPHLASRLSCTAAVALVALGCDAEPPAPPPGYHLPTITVEEMGLESPTAVIHDSRADVYLVANAPAPRSGVIVRVSPSGKIVDRSWINGEDADVSLIEPKALAIRGDTLYVADQNCIRLFHRTSGIAAGSICPGGGPVEFVGLAMKFDTVIATIRGPAVQNEPAVLSLSEGGSLQPVPGSAISNLTGIAAGPWGLFVTSEGEIYVSQIAPAGPRPIIRGSAKQVGGIVATRAGSFAFSNRTDSTVVYVDVRYTKGRGALYTLARELAEPGQLGYDARRDRILIPETGRNRLSFVELMNTEGAWVPNYSVR